MEILLVTCARIFLALLPTQHALHSTHTCFCQIFLHMYIKCKVTYPLNRNKLHIGNSQQLC